MSNPALPEVERFELGTAAVGIDVDGCFAEMALVPADCCWAARPVSRPDRVPEASRLLRAGVASVWADSAGQAHAAADPRSIAVGTIAFWVGLIQLIILASRLRVKVICEEHPHDAISHLRRR